jgi:hypothetical protein
VVRGTFSPEDAFFDLLATGVCVCGRGGGMCVLGGICVCAWWKEVCVWAGDGGRGQRCYEVVCWRKGSSFFGGQGPAGRRWAPTVTPALRARSSLPLLTTCACPAVPCPAGAPFDEEEAEGECRAPAASAKDEAADEAQRRRLSGHCHSGMARAALYLGAKFGPLLRPLYAQGMEVTLVGHSLGAGGSGDGGWGLLVCGCWGQLQRGDMERLPLKSPVVLSFPGQRDAACLFQPAAPACRLSSLRLCCHPCRRGRPAGGLPAQPGAGGRPPALLGLRDAGVHGQGNGAGLLGCVCGGGRPACRC